MSADPYEIKDECLDAMTVVFEEYKEKYERAGGDPNEFETLIIEQWRPW
jgi:hypothetical protein